MEKTVCELFAGVGGFRLGIEATHADWKTVWFSQWEPGKTKQWAHDCYTSHFGDIDEYTGIDIGEVNKEIIPEHTLLVGGFPCQDYSVARSLSGEKGIEGKKGVLWWQIREILEKKQAPFVILENVDRLLKSPSKQRGRDFGVILACFADLGYSVEWRVVNAADYGAAQRRRRTFIFAYRNSLNYAKTISKLDVKDIFEKEGFMAKAFPITSLNSIKECDIDYKDIQDVSDNFNFQFEIAGYMKDGHISTTKIIPNTIAPINLRELLDSNVDEKYFLGDNLEKWKYLKGSKKIERTTKEGFTYIFSEGKIAFPDSIDLPARTMLTSESTLNRSTHVIEDPENKKLRLLTPEEAEAIQGFPKGWTDTGMPQKFRYFCMGNALVVPMITRMTEQLNLIIKLER